MKYLLPLFFILPLSAHAIFLGPKDQVSLEKVLRQIPSALLKTEDKTGFTQKSYAYPTLKGPFQISCTADHEKSATEPSKVLCYMKLIEGAENGVKVVLTHDEYVVTINDSATVGNFQKALVKKRLVSLEHLKFKNRLGINKEHPRFVINCGKRTCKMTFSNKDPESP